MSMQVENQFIYIYVWKTELGECELKHKQLVLQYAAQT